MQTSKIHKLIRNQAGQGLIEVLAALAVAMVVLTALSVAAVSSVRNATFAKNQSQATAYGRQAMESIRAYRDVNPQLFFQSRNTGCYQINERTDDDLDPGDPANGFKSNDTVTPADCTGYANGEMFEGGIYSRQIYLQKDPADCPAGLPGVTTNTCNKITVRVYWRDASGSNNKSELVTFFGNWQGVE